jgi:hypothetical protein
MFSKYIKVHYYILGILLYLSLVIGFIFNENLSGGAYGDYVSHKDIIIKFSQNFYETLLNFNKEPTRHSPFLLILLSFFQKTGLSDFTIRLINLHFLLLIILFFYKCLKIKLKNYKKETLYLISLSLFLSPHFRALSIWTDSRLYGLLFFIISIYYFLNFLENKKYKFCLLNTFFLILSSYFSPNYCLFVIFFLFFYFKEYKIGNKTFLILIINFILALPAIYYVFILKIYFFLTAVSEAGKTTISLNPANKIILISSILLFHYIPLLFVTQNKYKIKLKYFLILIFLFLISIYFFNYDMSFTGGGIIYKLSNLLFSNNYLLYAFAFIGVIVIFNLCFKNLNNTFLIFVIILSNPQLEIYHKYYDPVLLILFFTLFNINFNRLLIEKRVAIFYIFNLVFLIANLIR